MAEFAAVFLKVRVAAPKAEGPTGCPDLLQGRRPFPGSGNLAQGCHLYLAPTVAGRITSLLENQRGEYRLYWFFEEQN
jgi:hypothetical protein